MPHCQILPPSRARLPGLIVLTLALFGPFLPVAGAVDERLPPAVEEFRQALLLEREPKSTDSTKPNKAAIEFRRKNLAEKAKKLTSLADMARALTLLDWNTDSVNV